MTFRFKRFGLNDCRCGMKIGTDGVLLGAWAGEGMSSPGLIADIGTGCGMIALMLGQRFGGARVIGIDIDEGAVADATDNVAASPFNDRVSICRQDFAGYDGKVDLLVSNPPFFTNGEKAPESSRAVARHADTLSPSVLVGRGASLLNPGGRLAIITTADSPDNLIFEAEINHLHPRRICHVCSRELKDCTRILWEFAVEDGHCETSRLIIRGVDNQYTQQFIDLTKDFYLYL